MSDYQMYHCTTVGCGAPLAPAKGGLSCPHGHFVPFAHDSDIPVFAREPHETTEYSRHNAAEVHDNALRWVFATFKSDEPLLRERLAARLRLKPGSACWSPAPELAMTCPTLHVGFRVVAKSMLRTWLRRCCWQVPRATARHCRPMTCG